MADTVDELELFLRCVPDTTPERIVANRNRMLVPYMRARKDPNKNKEFIEWYEYFDKGKLSETLIDDLPKKVKKEMALKKVE